MAVHTSTFGKGVVQDSKHAITVTLTSDPFGFDMTSPWQRAAASFGVGDWQAVVEAAKDDEGADLRTDWLALHASIRLAHAREVAAAATRLEDASANHPDAEWIINPLRALPMVFASGPDEAQATDLADAAWSNHWLLCSYGISRTPASMGPSTTGRPWLADLAQVAPSTTAVSDQRQAQLLHDLDQIHPIAWRHALTIAFATSDSAPSRTALAAMAVVSRRSLDRWRHTGRRFYAAQALRQAERAKRLHEHWYGDTDLATVHAERWLRRVHEELTSSASCVDPG